MTSSASEKQRQSLLQEKRRIEQRDAKRCRDAQADRKRRQQIDAALHRLEIVDLLGCENAVRIATRSPASWRQSKFNDLRGTVVKVRRTRASVRFENGETWSWPVDDLMAVGGTQGCYLTF